MPVLYGLWRLVLPGTSAADRVDHALHAAMGLLMIAMAWPWGADLPAGPQVVLFSGGAVWFVVVAPLRAKGNSQGRAVLGALPHVVMMAAMAWMVWAMDSAGTVAGGTGAGGMHDMPGMDMAGETGLAAMSLSGTVPVVTAVVLAVVLGAFGLAWLSRALDGARGRQADGRPREGGPVVDAGPLDVLAPACHAAMALGMAVMFAVLA
ncbi:DUF5134 domain-containing protein [Streptomyces griseoincarnatus]